MAKGIVGWEPPTKENNYGYPKLDGSNRKAFLRERKESRELRREIREIQKQREVPGYETIINLTLENKK